MQFLSLVLIYLSVVSTAFASEDQALAVRRIVSFWHDGEHSLALAQIQAFFERYPKSSFHCSLMQMEGDIHFEAGRYKRALAAYRGVESRELQAQSLLRRFRCLQSLGMDVDLEKEIELELSQATLENEERLVILYLRAELHLKKGRLEHAERDFKSLLDSALAEDAKVGLAQIYMQKRAFEKARDTYLELARDGAEEKREEFFYQAVLAQAYFDPAGALVSSRELQKMEGKWRQEALFRELVLLNELGHFREIIRQKDRFSEGLEEKRVLLLPYYLGHAYLKEKRLEDAAKELREFLRLADKWPDQQKRAHLSLVVVLTRLGHHEKAEESARTFQTLYPSDPETAQASLFRARALNRMQAFHEAREAIDILIQDYPAFSDKDAAMFERSMTYFFEKNYEKARLELLHFLEDYPSSPYTAHAKKTLPLASLRLLELSPSREARLQATKDIFLLLQSDLLSVSAKDEYILRRSQILYELGEYQAVIGELEALLNTETAFAYQAHFLLAMAYYEGSGQLYQYAKHSEKALELRPDHPEKQKLHLNLFQAYYRLSEEAGGDARHLDKAAQFLDLAMEEGQVSQDHVLWLARYDYDKVKMHFPQGNGEHAELQAARAIRSFRHFFGLKDLKSDLKLTKADVKWEDDLKRFVHLLRWMKHSKQEMHLLKGWLGAVKNHPDWPWKLHGVPELAMASALQREGQLVKARAFLRAIEDNPRISDLKVLGKSRLQLARLDYRLLPEEKRRGENEELRTILQALEDLQNRRQLASEPVHLEAGIDLALMRSKLSGKPVEVLERLLVKFKEIFISRDDLWSKDYHQSRAAQPEQDIVYQAYMMLVDAQIAYLQSFKKEDVGRGATYRKDAARTIYRTLLEGKFAVSEYLRESAELGLRALDRDEPLVHIWIEGPAEI